MSSGGCVADGKARVRGDCWALIDPFNSAVGACRPHFGDVWQNVSRLRRGRQSLHYLVRRSCLQENHRHYQRFTHQFLIPARASLLISCDHYSYRQTLRWAMLTSRKLTWGRFLCCEYHYTQLKPKLQNQTGAWGPSPEICQKKDWCEFYCFFYIYILLFSFCVISVSDSCLETGIFLPAGLGSAPRCKSGLSRTPASQN